ncbi:PLDc N-terminal domain-containing protein [Frondihabitans cladoniiphilus]|uniref:Cardiolipin synthase N-terminal domain-containing protein n=1 Tax=Frondihabitans cladoniiphilus TaxID=715785 RepID=A0ABP8W1D4_9MICO
MVKGLFVAIVAAVALFVYALVDCLSADRPRFRVLNKPFWVVVIIVLPVIGAVLWLTMGRRWGRAVERARYRGPDDDPAFLGRSAPSEASTPRDRREFDRRERELRRKALRETDERIRRLEQEFADRDRDDDSPGGPPAG